MPHYAVISKKRHCIARTIKNGESCMTDNLLRTMAIITEETAAESISGMWATVITGMVVVFLILGLLIGLLYIISFFCNLGNKKKKDAKPAEKPVEPAPAPVELIEEDENDDEVIAVISAAIAAYTAGDGKTYAIKRIKRAEKQPRSSWGNAGVNENTRSF